MIKDGKKRLMKVKFAIFSVAFDCWCGVGRISYKFDVSQAASVFHLEGLFYVELLSGDQRYVQMFLCVETALLANFQRNTPDTGVFCQ